MSTGQRVVLAIFYVFYPIFLRSRRENFVSPHYYFAWPITIYLRNKSYLKSTANFEMRIKVNKVCFIERRVTLSWLEKGWKTYWFFMNLKLLQLCRDTLCAGTSHFQVIWGWWNMILLQPSHDATGTCFW